MLGPRGLPGQNGNPGEDGTPGAQVEINFRNLKINFRKFQGPPGNLLWIGNCMKVDVILCEIEILLWCFFARKC